MAKQGTANSTPRKTGSESDAPRSRATGHFLEANDSSSTTQE